MQSQTPGWGYLLDNTNLTNSVEQGPDFQKIFRYSYVFPQFVVNIS